MDIKYTNGFNIDYDTDFDCEGNGCNEEGICRCTTISSVRADIDDAFEAFKSLVESGISDTKLNYAFLAKADQSVFPVKQFFNEYVKVDNIPVLIDANISSGYYGEELCEVWLENGDNILECMSKQLFNFFNRYPSGSLELPSDVPEIEGFILDLIKGSLKVSNKGKSLPDVEKATKYSILNLKLRKVLKTIIVPNFTHMKTLIEKDMKSIHELRPMFDKRNKTAGIVVCGTLVKKDDKFILVDGYHRYLAAMIYNPNDSMSYIVLEA
jgi:hypothetical protein